MLQRCVAAHLARQALGKERGVRGGGRGDERVGGGGEGEGVRE